MVFINLVTKLLYFSMVNVVNIGTKFKRGGLL